MIEPITREEIYLAYLTNEYKGNLPNPITREEHYLHYLCVNGGISGNVTQEAILQAINEYFSTNTLEIDGGGILKNGFNKCNYKN